jgi:hypothetical protein
MAVILFYISFISLAVMLVTKYFGLSLFHHEAISNVVLENEKHFHKIVGKGKHIGSQIHFENLHKLTMKIANFTKQEIIYLKRRFDSKQPKFFLKPQKQNAGGKHSVSFFLKNVSEYKDSLKGTDL